VEKVLNELLLYSHRQTEEEVKKFLDIVDNLEGKINLQIAKVLMKTFSEQPDWGTQESVISTLASGDPDIVIKAILEEMPRLLKEAPRWADTLIINEYNFNRDHLLNALQSSSQDIKDAVLTAINKPEIINFEPSIKQLIELLKGACQ